MHVKEISFLQYINHRGNCQFQEQCKVCLKAISSSKSEILYTVYCMQYVKTLFEDLLQVIFNYEIGKQSNAPLQSPNMHASMPAWLVARGNK